MDRRTLLFIVLSITIWYGWMMIFPPPAPPQQPTGSATTDIVPEPTETEPAAEPAVQRPVVPETTRELANCGVKGRWTNHGGALSAITLDDYHSSVTVTPVYSWILGGFGPWNPYSIPEGPAQVVSPEGAAFAVGAGPLDEAPVDLNPTTDKLGGEGRVGDIQVRHTIEIDGDAEKPCSFVMRTSWTNTGSSEFSGPLWISVHDALADDGGGMMARYDNVAYAVGLIDGSAWSLSDYADLEEPTLVDEGPVGYFGIMDRYFAALAVPEQPGGELIQSKATRNGTDEIGLHYVAARDLEPGATFSQSFTVYLGEKNLDKLTAVHEDLGNAVELGWFGFFARLLLTMLKLFYAAVGNWGLAIILLTVTVKVIFFPLTHSAFKSGQAMQAIQPQLKEIREKYKDDQQTLNEKTIELFRDNKVNPVGGCLPMVIQIPVFIALYNVLLTSVELYQTDFWYVQDLSSQDPYGVLPLAVMGLFVLQQQFTPTANMDPLQARMMKLMPLMFGLLFFTFPAGLVLYIFVNTTLSVLQQWYIRRTFKTQPTPAEAGA